jgi:uncharacterized ferritin-like protein (DUF455 family)
VNGDEFVRGLDDEVKAALARIGDAGRQAEPSEAHGVASLLATALKKELEAAEEAAAWLVSERDLEVKLALMRQCGDEAKHYRLVEERLRALGVDVAKIDPLAEGRSPMYAFLEALPTTVERIAAGPFAREALPQVHNEAFIAYCEAAGDAETARLYRDVIQPDEAHHHAMGRKLLAKLATTTDAQAKARAAATRTLTMAGELQEIARLKKGIAKAPGC